MTTKIREQLRSVFRYFMWLVFACLISLTAAWHAIDRASSIAEYRFLKRLSESRPTTQDQLDLASLMPGEWELVCDAHGYSGPFYVEKYGRTYPSVSDLQDGAWGLVFIDADGSYTSAAASCRSTGVNLHVSGCVTRPQAVLRRQHQNSTCLQFKN